MLRNCVGRSPDGAACGVIRVLLPRSPGFRRKRLHPGYDNNIQRHGA